jgi:hypothetical protein
MGRGEGRVEAAGATRAQRSRRHAAALAQRRQRDEAFARRLRKAGLVLTDLKQEFPAEWPKYSSAKDPEPEWLERAVSYYERFHTFREVANRISTEEEIQVTKSQMQKLLVGKARTRLPAGAPFNRHIELYPNGPDKKEIARIKREGKKEGLSAETIEDQIADYSATHSRVVSFIYSDARPWRDDRLIRQMMSKANFAHTGMGMRIAGLNFEGYLASALDAAGYEVVLYKEGNPGADVAAAVHNDDLLTGFSLKSQGRENEQTGGKVEISSLTPHGLGRPTNAREVRKVLDVALRHLDNYDQIICLQSVVDTYPDNDQAALRYNLLEVPRDGLANAIKGLSAKEINRALDSSAESRAVTIPIQNAKGQDLFKIRIFANKVAVAAIDKNFYRTHFSLWTKPPLSAMAPAANYQESPTGRRRGRKKKPASARGP